MIMIKSLLSITAMMTIMVWGADIDLNQANPDPEPNASAASTSLSDLNPELLQAISELIDLESVKPFLESSLAIEQTTKSVVLSALYNRIFQRCAFDPLLPLAVRVFTDLIDQPAFSQRLIDSITIQMVLDLYDQLQDHVIFGRSPDRELALLQGLSARANNARFTEKVESISKFAANKADLNAKLPMLIDDPDNLVPDHIADILRHIEPDCRTPTGILKTFVDQHRQDLLLDKEALIGLLRCGCRFPFYEFMKSVNVPDDKLPVIYSFLSTMLLESAHFKGQLHPFFIGALKQMHQSGNIQVARDLIRVPQVAEHLQRHSQQLRQMADQESWSQDLRALFQGVVAL